MARGERPLRPSGLRPAPARLGLTRARTRDREADCGRMPGGRSLGGEAVAAPVCRQPCGSRATPSTPGSTTFARASSVTRRSAWGSERGGSFRAVSYGSPRPIDRLGPGRQSVSEARPWPPGLYSQPRKRPASQTATSRRRHRLDRAEEGERRGPREAPARSRLRHTPGRRAGERRRAGHRDPDHVRSGCGRHARSRRYRAACETPPKGVCPASAGTPVSSGRGIRDGDSVWPMRRSSAT